jgi:hypothetical protein
MALLDGSTGWCQGWHLGLRLEEEIIRSARYSRDLSLIGLQFTEQSLVGHQKLALYTAMADFAVHGLRGSDLPGVVGPEEYVVVLPETDREGAQRVADRLQDQLNKFSPLVQVVCFPQDGQTGLELIEAVLCAPVKAKQAS